MVVAVGFISLWRGDSPTSIVQGTSWGRGSWGFDVEDDRLLVGFADNVFFGQVQATWPVPVGVDDDADPHTAYSVLPVSDIKGDLPGPITVMQLGGIQEDGTLMLMEGDSVLSVGGTYLLLTRSPRAESGEVVPDPPAHYLIAPGYDHLRASTPAQVEELTTRFATAYAQEIDPIELLQSPAPSTPSPPSTQVPLVHGP